MIRLLALLCALFTAAVAAEILSGPAETAPTGSPTARPPAAPSYLAPAGEAIRANWLPDLLARPLFAPDRRPAAGAVATDAGLPRLAGIIRSSGGTVAIFQPAGTAKPVLVHHGERIDGWQVGAIETDAVTLQKQGTRVVLNPRFAEASAAAPAAPGLTPTLSVPLPNRR